MEDNEVSEKPPVKIDSSIKPGAQLKLHRCDKDLSITKVASHLHLKDDVIEALENDHYDELGAPVFIRGYIVNYARFVGVPHEPLIACFDNVFEAKTNVKQGQPTLLTLNSSNNEYWSKSLTFIVIGVLIVLSVIWLKNNQTGTEFNPFNTSSPPVTETNKDGKTIVNESDINETIQLLEKSLVNELQNSGALYDSNEPNTEKNHHNQEEKVKINITTPVTNPEKMNTTIEQVEKLEPKINNQNTPNETNAITFIKDDSDFSPVSVVAENPEKVPPPNPSVNDKQTASPGTISDNKIEIIIKAKQDAWVKIENDKGNKVMNRLVKANTSRVIQATYPLRFVLGNSNALEILINGKIFNHAVYSKANVARFKLNK